MRAHYVLSCLWIFVALSVSLAREVGKTTPTKPPLNFTASPVSSSFHENQKVVFRFTIQNTGEADIFVSPAFILNYDIHLEIEGGPGKPVSWCGVVTKWVFLGDTLTRLQPGRSLSVSRQISCDDTHDFGYSFPGPGEYSVSATYRFPVSPKKLRDNPGPVPVASGPYKAEPVRFRIVQRTE